MTSQESEHLSADEIAYLEQVFVSIAGEKTKQEESSALLISGPICRVSVQTGERGRLIPT